MRRKTSLLLTFAGLSFISIALSDAPTQVIAGVRDLSATEAADIRVGDNDMRCSQQTAACNAVYHNDCAGAGYWYCYGYGCNKCTGTGTKRICADHPDVDCDENGSGGAGCGSEQEAPCSWVGSPQGPGPCGCGTYVTGGTCSQSNCSGDGA